MQNLDTITKLNTTTQETAAEIVEFEEGNESSLTPTPGWAMFTVKNDTFKFLKFSEYSLWQSRMETQNLRRFATSYEEIPDIRLIYSSYFDVNSLELEAVAKLLRFGQVTDVYFDESPDIITIRAILDLEVYNYDLMTSIFESVEFPLKDKYENDKLINFEYVYRVSAGRNQLDHYGRGIFSRSLYVEQVSPQSSGRTQ